MLTSTSPNSYPWHHIVGINFCDQVKLLAQMKWLNILAIHWDGMQQGKERLNGLTKVELLEDCNMTAPRLIEDNAIYIPGLHAILLKIIIWLAETYDTKD